jgi:hypothetical protein
MINTGLQAGAESIRGSKAVSTAFSHFNFKQLKRLAVL